MKQLKIISLVIGMFVSQMGFGAMAPVSLNVALKNILEYSLSESVDLKSMFEDLLVHSSRQGNGQAMIDNLGIPVTQVQVRRNIRWLIERLQRVPRVVNGNGTLVIPRAHIIASRIFAAYRNGNRVNRHNTQVAFLQLDLTAHGANSALNSIHSPPRYDFTLDGLSRFSIPQAVTNGNPQLQVRSTRVAGGLKHKVLRRNLRWLVEQIKWTSSMVACRIARNILTAYNNQGVAAAYACCDFNHPDHLRLLGCAMGRMWYRNSLNRGTDVTDLGTICLLPGTQIRYQNSTYRTDLSGRRGTIVRRCRKKGRHSNVRGVPIYNIRLNNGYYIYASEEQFNVL